MLPTVSAKHAVNFLSMIAAKREEMELHANVATRCRADLSEFIQEFWGEISSSQLTWNWHIDYIAQHLMKLAQRVAEGKPKEYDLIINIPPGTTKSITCSVMFPVWCWINWHWMRFIVGSYSAMLSLEQAELSRDLVRSNKFKSHFPELDIKQDKDTKSNFKIIKHLQDGTDSIGGNRYTTSVGGTLTGFHGHILIVDDPLNPKEAVSDTKLKAANHWMEQTLSTRKIDKAVTPTILIMQRLHEEDPTGHMLAKKKKSIFHICIPGEIKNFKQYVRPIELVLKYENDLLDPVRMPQHVLEDMEIDLGQYGYAGQIGQNPVPPTGGMFKVDHFQIIDELPTQSHILMTVRYWDKAATMSGGAYSCGVKACRLTDNKIVVIDVKRGQWSTETRENIIRQTAEVDGENVIVYTEQEPGPIWEEELVQMGNGERKKLKEIVVGDKIIDGQGKIATVDKVHLQGLLPSLCIQTYSGRMIYAAFEHPFLTPTGWVNASDLTIDNVLALRTYREQVPITQPTVEECRLAGYFVGDGCCTFARGNSINASISCPDPLEGLDIVYCADTIGASAKLVGKARLNYYLSGSIRPWLWQHKLAGKRTENKEVPDWIITASDECVANFIGAYFACDGSVSRSKGSNTVEFYSINLPLLQTVQSLLLRFGIYARLRKRNYSPEMQTRRQFCYRLSISKSNKGRGDDSAAKFAERIPVFGKKRDILKTINRFEFDKLYMSDAIVNIKVVGDLPCRCLTINGSNSFLVNDFVVHNSGGKESAEGTIRNLIGFSVHADRPTGDKTFRADPYSVQVNSGNVMLMRGSWNHDFINEHRFFPFSRFKDQVDATSGAFNHLAIKRLVRRIT